MPKIVLSAVAYAAIVFPLALGWHLGLFPDRYHAFGYFDGTPNIPLGLLSIALQGIALGLIYPLFHNAQAGFVRAFQFAALIGVFFWTSHVLAFVAKQNVPNATGFVALETGYLVVQFGVFAVALGLIYRSGP